MPIDSEHPQYLTEAGRWQRCRDVAAGSDAVKGASTKYLPRLEGMNAFGTEYPGYLQRAMFYGAFARTLDGLAGAIFQKAPIVTVPTRIQDHVADITLTNQTFELFAHTATREVLTTGRYGVLVDMAGEDAPNPPPRPYWVGYRAEDVISWRSERRGGDQMLVRVVIREVVEHEDMADAHKVTYSAQYRELLLNEAGQYQQRIWVKLPAAHLRDASRVVWIASDPVTPTRRGAPLSFIPFVFVNARGLAPDVDKPPLVDLADVVLSHYRSSADREHALHYTAAPTPWVSGAKGTGPLKIGSSIAWDLEKDGKAGMLEFSGPGVTAIKEAMDEKRQLMAVLGARLLEDRGSQQEAARTVEMRHAGEHAALRTIAQIVEQGLTLALQWHAWWMGTETKPTDADASIELHKDFFNVRMTAEELKAILLAWQADAISYDTLYANLTRGDVARPGVSVADEQHAIEHAMPPALPRPADDNDDE